MITGRVLAMLATLSWAAVQSAPKWKAEVDQVLDAVFAKLDAQESKSPGPANPNDKAWVIRKLEHMVEVDQTARNAFDGPQVAGWGTDAREYFIKRLGARMDRIDRANTAEVKELLKIHGWFTISGFGKDADHLAWLLVQHADRDPKFQEEVLEILTRLYPNGETSPKNYAYLWDRVAVNTGQKQRYGTQGRCTAPGTWEPRDLEDPGNVDVRRTSVGLPSMAAYKQIFKDRGLCP